MATEPDVTKPVFGEPIFCLFLGKENQTLRGVGSVEKRGWLGGCWWSAGGWLVQIRDCYWLFSMSVSVIDNLDTCLTLIVDSNGYLAAI